MRMTRKRFFMIFSLVPVLFSLCSCGGGGGDNPPPSPTVTTTPATGIGTGTAMLNGTVNPNAQATSAWLEWGTDSALSSFTATPSQAIGAGTTAQTVSATITGLTSGIKYYYRAAATNASGTQKGEITSFTTAAPNSPPTVTTSAATTVITTGATLNGTVLPNELATTGWFEWGTDATLTTFTATASQSLGSGKTSVPITATLSLSAGTTYYFRVAATNSVGTSKGSILTFNTVAQPPSVTTAAATSVTINGATLEGTVAPNGLATTARFEYGTDPLLSTITTTPSQNIGSGTTGQPISASVSSLSAATTYYFRVSASNSAGESKGNIVSFSTVAESPTATTAAATSITSNSARLNGAVNPNGLATTAWFEWGTVFNLSSYTSTSTQSLGSGMTGVPVNATPSLSPGTTYYFRVAAVNSTGTSKGTIFNFTTSLSPTVTTKAATFNSETSGVLEGDVNPNGFSTTVWFEYGTDPTLSTFSTTSNQGKGSGTSILPLSATISLSAYTTYYFRAAASNSGGTQKGAIKNFQTGVRYVAVGDSITEGSDGTNIIGGYEPTLGNLLLNNPYTIANQGVGGFTSADGAAWISSTLSNYPSAQYYLIMYGTNDSNATRGAGYPVSKAIYKANMQAIITAIKNAFKIPYLAKVPYVDSSNPNFPAGEAFSNVFIQQYNDAIVELVNENGIPVTPPDFYGWFQSNTGQLQDGIHPNSAGYQSMATLWSNVLP